MRAVYVQIIMAYTQGVNTSVNFDLTEDEQMLKAVVERFVADRYDMERRRAYLVAPEGFSRENWNVLADIGLLAAPFAYDDGGLAASQTDIALIAEVLGSGLVVEPWIDSVLVAGGFFAASARPELRQPVIDAFVQGKTRFALAHREANARGHCPAIASRAQRDADGWRLNGSKSLVVAGVGADGFIVSALIEASADQQDDVAFFFVPADSLGLTQMPFRLIDGGAACTLDMQNVVVPDNHRLNASLALRDQIESRAAIARCAEAVGIMQMLFDATRDYLRTRKQFSAPLSSFQALQHRMVAQYAVIEQARALLDLAVMTDAEDAVACRRAVAGARAYISDASITFGHEMIQMHGGMGVSDELNIGHGHKRLLMLSRYPETSAVALDAYAGLAA